VAARYKWESVHTHTYMHTHSSMQYANLYTKDSAKKKSATPAVGVNRRSEKGGLHGVVLNRGVGR
jgi:hypothetical protein